MSRIWSLSPLTGIASGSKTAEFRPGERISLEIAAEPGSRLVSAVLHYRHVDQSAAYHTAEMSAHGDRFRAEIPGQYTDSPYPMLYYFELRDTRGAAWIYPGFNAELANQPYFIVRQAEESAGQ